MPKEKQTKTKKEKELPRKKINVLITTDTFFPKKDGITRFFEEVIFKLSKDKYNIVVAAPSYSDKKETTTEKYGDILVVKFPMKKTEISGYRAARPDKKVLRRLIVNSDVVWINSAASIGMKTIFLCKKLKTPCISFMHSMEWEQLGHASFRWHWLKNLIIFGAKILAWYVYNKLDLIMVPSEAIEKAIRRFGIKTKRRIVYLGVGVKQFVPTKDKDKAKEKIKINPSYTVIGYCGRISLEKNVETLYKAFEKVRKEYPKTILLIVGEAPTKKDNKKWRKYRNVIVTGFKENVVPYYQAMDIFVMPSLTETTSLALLEAMSTGLAVVSTPVGAIKTYIKNKQNGYLFPCEDVDVLAAILKKLLKFPEVRAELGKKARQTVEKRYSWRKTREKIEKVLDKY